MNAQTLTPLAADLGQADAATLVHTTAAGLQIVRVPALSDNYIWLLHDSASGETAVIDPAEAAPVLTAAAERGWTITQIWNTHWHPDHVGGNAEIKAATGARVTGPAAEADKIDTLDVTVRDGNTVTLGQHRATVWDVPAHTAGHIAYDLRDDGVVLVGDTMFAMGCGRLFEGTADQMFANMQRLGTLPDDTVVLCAHEYTLSNAKFAVTVDPDNAALAQRLSDVTRVREQGGATIPTTIGAERATNPFLRAETATRLAEVRTAKDNA